MCGIAGILNADGRPVVRDVLHRMTSILRHRGPDGEGEWASGPIGLGHRRLAIVDLSPLGAQPMQVADGALTITYNGEIYNFRELRRELETLGYTFRSETDTEVVLAAYHAWGESCVARFNGMFAFAIWDERIKHLFLARDRYGIKPLYWARRGATFLFASEVKALLQHEALRAAICVEALNEYFSFQNIFSDLTLFDGVKLLPPAHTMTVPLDGGSCEPKRYWDYSFVEEEGDEREYVEELQRLFERAVDRQLFADVEIGAYLSGGMDSGAITCLSAGKFPNFKTFTAGFDLSSASGLELGFDERRKAEFLAHKYRTEHYQVVLKAGDMERVMPDLIWHLEDLRVGQSYPNFYVARLASRFVKVVMSGAGGDELFAGYPWRYYRAVNNQLDDHYVDKYYRYWQRLIPDRIKPRFFDPRIAPRALAHSTRAVFESVINGKGRNARSPEDYVNRSLYFEIKTFLHGLLVVEDKLSMAHGLETRLPFLDNDVVDFAQRVPVRHKLRNLEAVSRIDENELETKAAHLMNADGDGKLILRRALQRYVPESYAFGTKQGFSAPDASWFKGESIDYIRGLLFDREARLYEYIQPETAQAFVNEHFTGKHNHRLLIWSLVCFEWWCRTFVDRSAPGGSLSHEHSRLPFNQPILQ